MKIKILLITIGVISVIFCLFLAFYDENNVFDNDKNEIIQENEEKNNDILKKDLIKKYNAVDILENDINYTIEAQDFFKNNKIVIFGDVFIDDIFRENNSTFISFTHYGFNTDYLLKLDCGEFLNKAIYSSNDMYIIVANIYKVEKKLYPDYFYINTNVRLETNEKIDLV